MMKMFVEILKGKSLDQVVSFFESEVLEEETNNTVSQEDALVVSPFSHQTINSISNMADDILSFQ
ncbi:hypothetical protein D0T50_08850 [Bacteroides sp. 214]|uniref:hypothetical protein n=1 Tax=Bacteroides sp. 214 TaxID=2302935 RepID=UPI0013D3158A|nr:hypothetical protein [Bacteroides sp. 214]NDW12999.1 hypothetical protein [Bacteroides sp. 214]